MCWYTAQWALDNYSPLMLYHFYVAYRDNVYLDIYYYILYIVYLYIYVKMLFIG